MGILITEKEYKEKQLELINSMLVNPLDGVKWEPIELENESKKILTQIGYYSDTEYEVRFGTRGRSDEFIKK